MEEKKYIKISLGTAICIFIIIILIISLICLGFYTYNVKKDNSGNSMISSNMEETSTPIELSNENKSVENETMENETPENAVTNVGTKKEININDKLVNSVIKKVDFDTYVKASMYKAGTFNINTIPNDLILRCGWDKIDSSNKQPADSSSLDFAVSKTIMKQSITNIFGAKIKYTDDSFASVDVEKFHNYGGYIGSERKDKLCQRFI